MPKIFGYFIATILGQENLVSAVFWYRRYYNDKNSLMGFTISRKNWRKFTKGCQLFTEIFRDFKSSDLLRNVFIAGFLGFCFSPMMCCSSQDSQDSLYVDFIISQRFAVANTLGVVRCSFTHHERHIRKVLQDTLLVVLH